MEGSLTRSIHCGRMFARMSLGNAAARPAPVRGMVRPWATRLALHVRWVGAQQSAITRRNALPTLGALHGRAVLGASVDSDVAPLPENVTKTNLGKLKVADLKQHLRLRDLETSGLKADLVERLLSSLNTVSSHEEAAAPAAAASPAEAGGAEGGGKVRVTSTFRHWLMDKMNPTGFELWFLGTSSGSPTLRRNVSAIMLRMEKNNFLFDCGEGTQHQIMRTCLKPGKIENIFITHMHGDHCFGLPGLLCSIANSRHGNELKDKPLNIWGPPGIKDLVRVAMYTSRTHIVMPVIVNELDLTPTMDGKWPKEEKIGPNLFHRMIPPDQPAAEVAALARAQKGGGSQPVGRKAGAMSAARAAVMRDGNRGDALPIKGLTWSLVDEKGVSVRSAQLRHRVPCWGYVVEEHEREGRLDAARCEELGLPPGPIYKELKAGRPVTTPEGRVIEPAEVVGPPLKGRKIVVLGDTCDSDAIAGLARGADVVTHESTFNNQMLPKAIIAAHSTAGMAGEFAAAIAADQLILTHFSARYSDAPYNRPGANRRGGGGGAGGGGKGEDDDDDTPEVSEDEERSAVSQLISQARETFGRSSVMAAHDFFRYAVPRPPEPGAEEDAA